MSRKIAVCDSETDPFKFGRNPKPFIWGVYDGCEYWEFTDTGEMVGFLEDKEWIVYAHNGGKFDFFFLADFIDYLEPLTVINGRITKFKIGACEFRDSFAILPVPLAAHAKTKIDYAIFEAGEREKPENWKAISDYLHDDCRSLYDMVARYVDAFGVNLTLASGAMKTWQKMSGIPAPKSSDYFYHEFKRFYYGGRVECFKKGIIDKPFKVADINSAYPDAMTRHHPWGTNYIESNELPIDKGELNRSFIHMRAKCLGAFPVRGEIALEFPNDGEFREMFVTGWEFDAARDTGALVIDEIYSVYQFVDTVMFTDYVDRFFADKKIAKECNDVAGYILAKLHLNSLYGKFGANPENYEQYITCAPCDIDAMAVAHNYEFAEMFGRHAIMCKPIPEHSMRFYNVAVAASITGFVRAYLWRAISKCKGVMYCDTDSIAAHDTHRLQLGPEVGQWNIEAECDHGGIAGKKLYAFHGLDGKWKTASKGVRLTHSEIMRVCNGETIKYAKDVPTYSLKTGVRFIEREVRMT